MTERPQILYTNYGGDRWFKREWDRRCPHVSVFKKHCQGVQGHTGPHWYYQRNGNFFQTFLQGGCSSTPPIHPKYVSPLEMQPLLWSNHYTDTEVTDPEELKRIKEGRLESHEAITQPTTE